MKNQIDEDVKVERLDQLMMLQQSVSMERMAERVGTVCEVLVEGRDEDGWYGRSILEAPESDGNIRLIAAEALVPGSYVRVRITAADAYDLTAEVL